MSTVSVYDRDPSEEVITQLKQIATKLRIDSIKSTNAAKSGWEFLRFSSFFFRLLCDNVPFWVLLSRHPSSCASCADILAVLYWHTMKHNPMDPRDPNNDRFVLSKVQNKKRFSGELIDWLICVQDLSVLYGSIDWLIDWLTGWLTDCVTVRQIDWLTALHFIEWLEYWAYDEWVFAIHCSLENQKIGWRSFFIWMADFFGAVVEWSFFLVKNLFRYGERLNI